MIDVTKLSNEEFRALEKSIKQESINRKNDYTPNLPVVTSDHNNCCTLWYKAIKLKITDTWTENGTQCLTYRVPNNKKELDTAHISFYNNTAKSACKYGAKFKTVKGFTAGILSTIKYIDMIINRAEHNHYATFYEDTDKASIYTLYFKIAEAESYNKSVFSTYHQIVTISQLKDYTEAYTVSVNQRMFVHETNTFNLPPSECKCDKLLFNVKLQRFYDKVKSKLEE